MPMMDNARNMMMTSGGRKKWEMPTMINDIAAVKGAATSWNRKTPGNEPAMPAAIFFASARVRGENASTIATIHTAHAAAM